MELVTLQTIEEALLKAGLETEEEKEEWLKERCNELNIQFHHRAGYNKLVNLILEHYSDESEDETEEDEVRQEVDPASLEFKSLDRYPDESEQEYRVRKEKEAKKLIRVRITCMNPVKRDWQGEVFTVANDIMTIRRMVPFGVETHVEQALLHMIRDRRYQEFSEKKSAIAGGSTAVGSQKVEFAVEVLPSLTKEELNQLAHTQRSRVQPQG